MPAVSFKQRWCGVVSCDHNDIRLKPGNTRQQSIYSLQGGNLASEIAVLAGGVRFFYMQIKESVLPKL